VRSEGAALEAQRAAVADEQNVLHPRRGPAARLLLLARKKPLGTIAGVIILVMVAMAIFAPLIAPFDPTFADPRHKFLGSSANHFFGTDNLGRDVFSQIVYGARTSLWAGITATIFGTIFGSLIGMASGYAGGRIDMVIQRIMDALQALPLIVLLLVVVSAVGPSLWNIIWALSIAILPAAGRIIRGNALVVKNESYIEAARVVGCRPDRILLRHVLPNVSAYILVIASVTIGGAILAEAALSFLGLGVPPPTPTWGGMLSSAGRRFFESHQSLALYPGLAITIAVLSFNLLGDTLRDVLDPRLRGR